ncbi:Galactoside-binding lectin family protein [Aphelenchoides avenae]|nr:Galactoside-binding lectin family protein [Aphelenchus avenae]
MSTDDGTNTSVTTHNDPAVPYAMDIPGGVFAGKAILIKGTVIASSSDSRFNIDLCCGRLVQGDHRDNKALHINPRFDGGGSWFSKPDHDIVLNALVNNTWGAEQRSRNPLEPGKPFSIRILILKDYYKIALNGTHLCDFIHRVPIQDVKTIFINGCVRLELVQYQGTNPSKDAPQPSAPVENGHDERMAPFSVTKPSVPFVHTISRRGFTSPRVIRLTATPRMNAARFSVNLHFGTEYLFHLRADFPDAKDKLGSIVRNSTRDGEWLDEERAMGRFPFTPGHTFDLVLTAETDHVKVEVDGSSVCTFRYRPNLKAREVNTVTVVGDVCIQKFDFFERE